MSTQSLSIGKRQTRRPHVTALVFVSLMSQWAVAQTVPNVATDQRVESLLEQMTLEEKLGQLAQYRGEWSDTGPKVPEGGEEEIRAGKVGSFLGVHGAEYTRQMQQMAVEESRLKIPLLFAQDVIHGFRTVFPMPIAEACSWDPEAVERAARLAAIEATAHGLHWTFAPVCDVARDPRWGRIAEGAGEDPYLCSVLAAARVRGFQGDDLAAPDTMLACPKHFAAYGAAEGGRDYNTVDISPQTLHSIYLPPFHAAVGAGAETIMASFNEINGTPAHASRLLLTDVLRKDWGFPGLVVSDYTGVLELMAHGVAADRAAAGILALQAGVDIDMVSGIYIEDLPAAVRAGRLEERLVDDAVRRVLRAKEKLGLFDDPFQYHDPAREAAVTLTPDSRMFAREYAGKCVVLLKNDQQTLPLDRHVGTIAVVGPLADDARVMLGGWAMNGRAEDAITILQAVREAVGADTKVLHAQGTTVEGTDRSGFEDARRAAEQADVVVLVVGEHHDMSSEAHNRTSLDLPGVQQELAEMIHATGTPVVAVLVGGRPLSVSWLDENVPAILEIWFLGIEMGHAVADVLFGDVNPSGKLPVTFPRTVGQVPIYYNHKSTGRPPTEDNKYTSKYIDVHWTPLYPFGHGLSYTTFEYGALKLDADQIRADERVTASVEVTNTGSREGTEVVQLYVRDEVASVTPVVKQLRGFKRVHLASGESATVQFELSAPDLAIYDAHMNLVVEPGHFTVMAGGSSTNVVSARFEVVE